MRIVHLAPVWLPVSRSSSGGIETFLAQLVAAQQRLGHEVVLVASGDSEVDVPLVPAVPEGLVPIMQRGEAGDYAYYEAEATGAAIAAATGADVVHNHAVPGGLVLDDALAAGPPVVHTLHGQVTQDLVWSLRQRSRALVTVSHAQAATAEGSGAPVFGVCHNGIDMDDLQVTHGVGGDLMFLGRMEPEKGPDLAIEVARRLHRRLLLAGPVTDRTFFDEQIQPHLDQDVRYAGVLGHGDKYAALGASAALLVPSRWAEPFGMVSVEAMAVGTPVVALATGALPEVVTDGVTGRVVATAAELAAAVQEAERLDRTLVRKNAEERFGISAVALRYTELYRRAGAES